MLVPTLPFDGFLSLLRAEGFQIGIDSWLRVQVLVESCDGGIDPSRLKTVLSPLIATSPEEQRRFSDVFDRYYTTLAMANVIPVLPLRRQVERGPLLRRPTWPWKIVAALVMVFALVLVAVAVLKTYTVRKRQSSQLSGGVQTQQNRNAGPVAPTGSPGGNIRPATPSLVQVDAQPVNTTRLDQLRLVWSIPALLLAIYVVWFGLRRFAGGYLVRGSSEARRSWSRAIAVQVPIAAAPEVNQNIRRLRRRIPVPSSSLDLPRTIESTIRAAGFPRFRFRSGTRRPEYLVLIDRIASRDHQAALFHQLIDTLRERGQLAIEEYFFTRDPRVCVSARSGTAVYLADLLQRCAAHRMLIFGDGSALWNSMTGERAPWMDLLLDHPQTALLTPNIGGWTAREHALSEWMLVRSATLDGLSQVLDAFEERPEPPMPRNAPLAPEYPAVESKPRIGAYVDALRHYLGARNFRLATACALYPRLEWDLTLHLAAALDGQLLDHANLMRLAALPWFRKGFYPIALQQQLFERVPKNERRRLRQRIVELIEQGTASLERRSSLEVIVQRFDLSPMERQQVAREEAFARLAMTAGRSRLALRIPEPIRRSLFRFGVPTFGLRFWASAVLAILAAAGIIAAVTILPAVPSLHVTLNVPKPPSELLSINTKRYPPSPFQPNPSVLTVPQVARYYNFPTEFDGTGQSIALITLGGGYRQADLDAYFNGLKIPSPKVVSVSVDGGVNRPGANSNEDAAVEGPIEVAGAVAPGARIVVYFGPNTDQGFTDVIAAAVNDKVYANSLVSISWGGPEESWTSQASQALNKALQSAASKGITVCVAAGDNGANDGVGDGKVHVDFPASSPWALAVGGTRLITAKSGGIQSEIAWNEIASKRGATGGGFSTIFQMPDWQKGIKLPLAGGRPAGRGVPDVVANADPVSGYALFIDNRATVIGSTVNAVPLWAGLIALLNEGLGRNIGFLNPILYQTLGPAGVLRSITQGENRGSGIGYSAGPGWNPVTGWGTPDGRKLLQALRSVPPKPPTAGTVQ